MTEVASHRGSCGGGPDRASVVLPRQAPGGPPPPAPPPRESSGAPDAGAWGVIKSARTPERPAMGGGAVVTTCSHIVVKLRPS